MARKRRRFRWRPKRADFYAAVGTLIIVWEVAHDARPASFAVGMGLLGYRILAGPLQLNGIFDDDRKDPPPCPRVDE